MCGNVLERSEGGVGLECLRDVLGALRTDAVDLHTANEAKTQTSGGADGRKTMCGDLLEGLEGLVRLQTLRNVPGALCTDAASETASESQEDTSRGADSRGMMRGSVLEPCEGLVRLKTANGSQNQTSGGIDSREMGVQQRTRAP